MCAVDGRDLAGWMVCDGYATDWPCYSGEAPETLDLATPRQRRLLGDLSGWSWRAGCHFYAGPDQASVMTQFG